MGWLNLTAGKYDCTKVKGINVSALLLLALATKPNVMMIHICNFVYLTALSKLLNKSKWLIIEFNKGTTKLQWV